MKRFTIGFFMFVFLTASACETQKAKEEINPAQTVAKGAEPQLTAVAKVVFVGQKEACKCTADRIKKTWSSFEKVQKQFPDLAVEKIEMDVDEKRYDELDNLQSLMIAPGLYFFDEQDNFMKIIQGELTEEQIVKEL